MIDNGDGAWSITFIPEEYYNLTPSQASVLFDPDGSQELKTMAAISS